MLSSAASPSPLRHTAWRMVHSEASAPSGILSSAVTSSARMPLSGSNKPEYGRIGLPSSATSSAATRCSVHCLREDASRPAVSSSLALSAGGTARMIASHSTSLPAMCAERIRPSVPRDSDSTLLPISNITSSWFAATMSLPTRLDQPPRGITSWPGLSVTSESRDIVVRAVMARLPSPPISSMPPYAHLVPRTRGARSFLSSWFRGPLRLRRWRPGSNSQLPESRSLTRPPRVSLDSIKSTVAPSAASCTAAAKPATPPPTTTLRI